MSPHPSLQDLSGYVYGTLPEEQADTVADHVAACGECDTVVSQMESRPDEFVAALRAPAEIDAVAAEPACQQAVARLQQIGPPLVPPNPLPVGELTSLSAERANTGDSAGTTTDLGQFGPYRLLEKLGEGGMGAVYKALHTKLKRTVAVKILPAELTRDPRAIARFEREMEAVGKLDHPNIVRASDADEHNGTHYLVMEYVAGEDLSRLVKRLGPLPIADACELVRQAALGLQHAHEHGMVHRDIKPSNLMLSVAKLSPRASSPASSARDPALGESGATLKILDLGLALLQSPQPGGPELTGTGQAMGTADYMAPEQATSSHEVDIRADLYSLGCTLFKLLTGQPLFHGAKFEKPMQKLLAHIGQPPPAVRDLRPDVPAELAALLNRLLAKSPDDRPATPAAVAAELAPFAAHSNLSRLLNGEASTLPRHALAEPIATTGTHPGAASASQATERKVGQAFQPDQNVARPSMPDSRSGQAGKPDLRWLIAGAAAVVLLGIVIIVRDKYGNEKARLVLDKDDKIEIAQGDANSKPATSKPEVVQSENKKSPSPGTPGEGRGEGPQKSQVAKSTQPAPKPLPIRAEPPPKLPAGSPFGSQAMVQHPALIEGVRSWTICPKGPWGISWCAKFSPDGKWLATSDYAAGEIRIWNSSTRKLDRVIVTPGRVRTITWSPDSHTLAANIGHKREVEINKERKLVGGQNNEKCLGVFLWDIETCRLLRTLAVPAIGKGNIDWSPNANLIAMAGMTTNAVHVLDCDTGNEVCKYEHSSAVEFVSWSPDGHWIAATGAYVGDASNENVEDNQIQIWDATNSGHDKTFTMASPFGRDLAWSPDSQILAAGRGGIVEFWRIEDGAQSTKVDLTTTTKIKLSDSNTSIAWISATQIACSTNGRVSIVDSASGALLHDLNDAFSGTGFLTWLGSKQVLAAAHRDGNVAFLKMHSTEPLSVMPSSRSEFGGERFLFSPVRQLPIATGGLSVRMSCLHHANSESISRDGRWFASMRDGILDLHDLNKGESKILSNKGENTWSMSFSPDAKRLAVAMRDRTVIVWGTESGQKAQTFEEFSGDPMRLAWSNDGTQLAIADRESTTIRNCETGELLHTLKVGSGNGQLYPAFSPNDEVLALGTNKIELWDIAAETAINRFNQWATSLVWPPDSPVLVFTSNDGSGNGMIRFLDTESGRVLKTIEGVGAEGLILNDGRHYVWMDDGLVRVMETETERVETIFYMAGDHWLVLTPAGHYRGSPFVERNIVYVVETTAGEQLTLTPAEFATKFGWKNDPTQVTLPDK